MTRPVAPASVKVRLKGQSATPEMEVLKSGIPELVPACVLQAAGDPAPLDTPLILEIHGKILKNILKS
jgi:hypothetical protein